MTTRLLGAVILAALPALLQGCGGNGKPPAIAATGKVMFNKTTPAAGALIVLHPIDPAFEKVIGGKPFAKAEEDGTFKLTTYNEGDGAPEGEYGVTVEWRKADKAKPKFSIGGDEGGGGGGRSMLKPKYGNPQSPFMKVTIKSGDKNELLLEVD
jgi:hypothetical protein